jgi:hypothetical protein
LPIDLFAYRFPWHLLLKDEGMDLVLLIVSATPSPAEIAQHFAPPSACCRSAANRGRELVYDGDDVHGLLPLFHPRGSALVGKELPSARAGQTQANAALAG